MKNNHFNPKNSTWFIFLLLGIFVCNILFRLLFAHYGYIATEEGTLLYNQKLAYSGSLPFLDYDAWNSLFHDYSIGWFQLFIKATILNQRLFGLVVAVVAFICTLRLSERFKSKSITLWTAIFLTFGSWTYLYLSTIPYSEQTMTLLLLLSITILPANEKKDSNHKNKLVSASIATFATLLRPQALLASIAILVYLIASEREKKNKLLIIFSSIVTVLLALSPFVLRDPEQTLYAFTWPFFADKILVYQLGATASYSSFIVYLQEAMRDYGVLIALVVGGCIYLVSDLSKKVITTHRVIILVTFVSMGIIIPGLVHKPPYASYIYPSIPFLAILASWALDVISQKKLNKYALYSIVSCLLFQQFILFPHYKFLKTSIKTVSITPHTELAIIVKDVENNSSTNDTILSFYTPIPVLAGRKIENGFNRDRFSLSILPTDSAQKHHLISNKMIQNGLVQKKYKMVIISDDIEKRFLLQNEEFKKTMVILDDNYDLWKKYESMNMIESPKSNILKIYNRKL